MSLTPTSTYAYQFKVPAIRGEHCLDPGEFWSLQVETKVVSTTGAGTVGWEPLILREKCGDAVPLFPVAPDSGLLSYAVTGAIDCHRFRVDPSSSVYPAPGDTIVFIQNRNELFDSFPQWTIEVRNVKIKWVKATTPGDWT